jgi:F420-dependent oxidoreductase-like protein
MLELAIMIEGQNGLNWPRWQRIVRKVEELGFSGLHRSDHFTNARPPNLDSLELWTSLTWLAANTTRIKFGPLATPVSFRHPALTARMAAAVDDLSGGRLTLGLGAGWQEREHEIFGFDLLSIEERFKRFEEGVQVVKQLLENDDPVTFTGVYYRLKEAVLLPRPSRPGGPGILIGGNGLKRTLPIAAKYAREWNGVFLTPEQFKEHSRRLDELTEGAGRNPAEIERSIMAGLVFGADQAQLDARLAERAGGKADAGELKSRGLIVGTPAEVVDQLGALAEAGVQRVMLQWLDLDDMDGLEALARTVLSGF